MKKIAVVVAGLAAMVTGSAFAQDALLVPPNKAAKDKIQNSAGYDKQGSAKYRPLRVTPKPTPMTPTATAAPGADFGNALAAPFNAVGGVGGPIGFAGQTAGGIVSGATSVAFAPLGALTGGPVGISAMPAPPLPIKARYANTGKVFSSYDEGWSQDVPVDASGPIYQLDDKAATRTVTPFTLIAFPVAGLASAITTPLRP